MIGEQVLARMRDERGEALEEDQRLEDEVSGAVAPGTAELEEDAAALVEGEALARERGSANVASTFKRP